MHELASRTENRSAARECPGERVEFVCSEALAGTELMTVRRSTRRWRVFHERYAFGYCRAADSGVRYRGRDLAVTDGSVLVREPGEIACSTYICKPAEFRLLFVDPELLADIARELERKAPLHFPATLSGRSGGLYARLDSLCNAIEARAEALEQESRFVAVIAAFLRHTELPVPSGPGSGHARHALERAKAHLREHYSEAVSLDALATASGLSRFRLVHVFTRELGIAPHAYQIRLRIEHARTLLRCGMPSVAVAASVGFADQSHFNRHFRQVMQVTSNEYARAMRQQ